MGGINIQSKEFLKSAETSSTVFVVDKKRSWGNNLDFEFIKKIIEKYLEGKAIYTLGNSMGGFLAILATKYFSVKTCIAFVPQFSVNQEIIPNEKRFRQFTQNIKVWNYRSLEKCFNQKTRYYLFFGADNGIEDEQRLMFPSGKNIIKITFLSRSFIHNVAQRLKEDGNLYTFIGNCMKQKDLTATLAVVTPKYEVVLD